MTLERRFAQRGVAMLELAPGVTTPRVFSGRDGEHLATRRGAGLFDFSFMACFELTGPDCIAYLDRLQVRNLARLAPGRIAYTLICREDGTVLNDATVWCLAAAHYWIFTGRRGDGAHLDELARGHDAALADISHRHGVCALQGPRSLDVLRRCLPELPWAVLPYYGFASGTWAGEALRVARLGYAGELGYEIVSAALPALWPRLLGEGAAEEVTECGFEAADSLRIEAGHILFARELAVPVTPFEIGFGRLVRADGAGFLGSEALRARHLMQPSRRLVGLLPGADVAPDRLAGIAGCAAAPAQGYGGARLTSVCASPLLGRVLALGYVDAGDRHPGTLVRLADGSRARVARLPFYDPAKRLPRQRVV